MYIYIYIYIHTQVNTYTCVDVYNYQAAPRTASPAASPAARSGRLDKIQVREFRDVVFEDVVFDDTSSLTPH